MKVALVSLARRGGMVHFLAEIAGGLAPIADVAAIVSAQAALEYLPASVARVAVDTGRDGLESVARLLCPATWIQMAALIRGVHADVVHIAGVHQWNPLIAILCRMQAIPVVYTVHDPAPHPGSPWTIRLGDWLTARLADKLVALTVIGRTQLLARGKAPGSVFVVPHPMYTLFRRWRPRSARPEKIILFFGRVEAYKGLEILIQAFEVVRQSLPGWRLIVAGEGQLPRGMQPDTPGGIELINHYLPDDEVARLISRCSIVALPYTSASQSGVVALAQAFERPVVATAVGGLKEMIIHGRTGFLVRPADGAAFGRALRRLASDGPRRVHMQREIRRVAPAKWGPRIVARAYLDVYSSTLNR